MAINLDPDSIRDEVREADHIYTDEELALIESLPDDKLHWAIGQVVGDSFWEAYDSTRGDAIRLLLRTFKKED